MDSFESGEEIISRDDITVNKTSLTGQGGVASRVALIDNDTISKILELCAKLGITRPVYDPRLASDSLWNEAVSKIFMVSFAAPCKEARTATYAPIHSSLPPLVLETSPSCMSMLSVATESVLCTI